MSNRHILLGSAVAIAALPCLLVANQTTQPAGGATIVQPIRILDNIGMATPISKDGKVATVIFDNLLIGTSALKGEPLVVTRTETLRIPFKDNTEPVEVIHDVRGFVIADDARAALLIQACGTTTIVDLPKAIEDANENVSKRKLKAPESMSTADDFYVRIKATLPANAADHVTFFLLVEKDQDDPSKGAALFVDSVDVSIEAAQPAPGK